VQWFWFSFLHEQRFQEKVNAYLRKALPTNHFKKWNITAARLRGHRTLVLSTLLIFLDSFVQ
jgi:hypothetical protein